MYQISTFYDHILEASQQSGLEIGDILKQCRQWNISALEVNNWTFSNNPEHEKIIHDSGLKINCIYEFYNWQESNDFSKACIHIDRAQRLNCNKILIVPGFLSEEEALLFSDCSDYSKTESIMNESAPIQNIKNMLSKAVAYAGEKNITVMLEDFDDFKSPCAHANQLLYFFKNIPGLKWNFDTGNFAFVHETAQNGYEILKDYIESVHTKDRGPGLISVPTGSGILSMTNLITKVLNNTAVSNFSIEHFGSSNQLEFLKKSSDYLNQILFTS